MVNWAIRDIETKVNANCALTEWEKTVTELINAIIIK